MPCADILCVWPAFDQLRDLDGAAMAFLADALQQVDVASGGTHRLVPICVTGDGNCLAHSVSRACHGEEAWYSLLRKQVAQELRENEQWYLEHLPHVTKDEFDREVVAAGTLGEYMDAGTGLHLLAMANTIGRPVVLMASRPHMRDTIRSNCKLFQRWTHESAFLTLLRLLPQVEHTFRCAAWLPSARRRCP